MPDTREITRLRKAGNLDEAIRFGRQAYLETPNDVWVVRAFGWTLHDCLKRAEKAGNLEEMRTLLAEFARICIPQGEEDTLLCKARENWSARMPAGNTSVSLASLLQQAKQASDAGHRQDALQFCREAVKLYPNASQSSMSLGWEIQRALKDLVAQESIDGPVVQKLLQEYARIPGIEKPGNLHALVLTRAAQAASKEKFPAFIRFLKWWDSSNLQADDFKRFTPAGGEHSFDSRVELVIRAIHKTADAEENKENIAWATDFVGQYYEKFPEQEWFPYYYAQLLVKTGDLERARQMIIPIVRRKRMDFWSWHTLAGTFGPDENDKRCSCLCRSLLCRAQDESFLVNVHAELGELLVGQGLHEAAKYEIEKTAAIRASKNWKIPKNLKDLQLLPWYAQTEASKTNRDLYEQRAPAAEAIIFEGLPKLKAILMHQLPPSDDKPGLSFVAYLDKGKIDEGRIKTKHFGCLIRAQIGDPLTVQIDDASEAAMIVTVCPRSGAPWDILPEQIGVIRSVNNDKGITSVALGKDDFCLFYHDRFNEAAKVKNGDFVAVKLRKDVKNDRTYPLAFAVTTKEPAAEFFRRFQGNLNQMPDRQFGFVNHEIFVPPDLIDGETIAGGVDVKGAAILEFDKVKNRHSWRAVTVERL